MNNQMYRIAVQSEKLGIAVSTLYLHMSKGLWPRMISLGPRAKAIKASEFDAMVDARVAGKTEDEIKQLVARLMAARKNAS